MKKLLLVSDAWAPQVSGVVRSLDALIPRVSAHGFKLRIVEPGEFRTVPLPGYAEIRLALFARGRVRTIFDQFEPDAVHIMTEGPLGYAARAECRARGMPFTTWYHTHFQLYAGKRLRLLLAPAEAYLRRFHSPAKRVFVSTEALREELVHKGYSNLAIVPLGVDTDLFVRNPSPITPALPRPVFVYLGRISPEKSPEEFLELNLPGSKLVIGDGPLREKLEQKYGASAKFVGYQSGQGLVDWLSRSDVLVLPSRTETFGLVALEALACGLGVAAHDVMGPKEIITEGKDGYLSEDLREAALKCLDLARTDCRAKALQYSWERSADTFIKNLEFLG